MFRRILFHFRRMVALYVFLGVSAAALSVLSVYVFQLLVDHLTGLPDTGPATGLIAVYGIVAALEYLSNYASEYPRNQLFGGLYHYIKAEALKKVARIDYAAYQDMGTGTLVQLVENGAAAGRDILSEFHLRIASELLPGAVFSLAAIGMYDIRFLFGALSGYAVVFLLTRLLLKKLYAIKEETLLTEELLSKTYVRAFMELVVFRVNRRFKREYDRASEMGRQLTRAGTKIKLVHEFFFTAFVLLVLAVKLLMIIVAFSLIARGELSIGVLLALLSLADRIYQPIAIFNVCYVDYRLNRVSWDRFMRFIDAPDDRGLLGGDEAVIERGEIAFRGVSFGYGGAEILRDISFVIEPGKKAALVGSSGAGKSTIARLLLGLNKPTAGEITIDGQALGAMDLNSYYRSVAYISQDAPIFDGTLRENLCFDSDISEDEMFSALERAQLLSWAKALPDGLYTKVGEHGVKLSGGERQRLAFARVILQKPKIVVLDEPTSALDLRTEEELLSRMKEPLERATVLSIAHRLSTIQDSAEIFVLDGGVIVERGKHDQLLSENGIYANLAVAACADDVS